MAEITMTVRQIMNLGLWDKVCEYKEWSPWIYNEGQIEEDELVTFDDLFAKLEEEDNTVIDDLIESLYGISKELESYIENSENRGLTEDALQSIEKAITELKLANRN